MRLYLLSFIPPFCTPPSLFILSAILSISDLQRNKDLLFCCWPQPCLWPQVGPKGKGHQLLTDLQLSKGSGFLRRS